MHHSSQNVTDHRSDTSTYRLREEPGAGDVTPEPDVRTEDRDPPMPHLSSPAVA